MTSPLNSNQIKKGQKFWVRGDMYTFYITGAETDGLCAVLEISVPPESGPPLHLHTKESESFYVIDGEFSFQYGDEKNDGKTRSILVSKERYSSYLQEYR
jgi:quercetin dioxygenase-like cupin family protein